MPQDFEIEWELRHFNLTVNLRSTSTTLLVKVAYYQCIPMLSLVAALFIR